MIIFWAVHERFRTPWALADEVLCHKNEAMCRKKVQGQKVEFSLFNETTETACIRGQIQTFDIYILFSPVYTTLTFEKSHT